MNTSDRLWEKVNILLKDQCWPWIGATDPKGYGNFWVTPRPDRVCTNAHRMAWCLANNVDFFDLPKTTVIRHLCHNPACCNPAHLIPGSQKDNIQDKVRRGTSGVGEDNSQAKLSVRDVSQIRLRAKQGECHCRIAEDYPVNPSHVSSILRGSRWSKVVEEW